LVLSGCVRDSRSPRGCDHECPRMTPPRSDRALPTPRRGCTVRTPKEHVDPSGPGAAVDPPRPRVRRRPSGPGAACAAWTVLDPVGHGRHRLADAGQTPTPTSGSPAAHELRTRPGTTRRSEGANRRLTRP
jgi:hypothetical protein